MKKSELRQIIKEELLNEVNVPKEILNIDKALVPYLKLIKDLTKSKKIDKRLLDNVLIFSAHVDSMKSWYQYKKD